MILEIFFFPPQINILVIYVQDPLEMCWKQSSLSINFLGLTLTKIRKSRIVVKFPNNKFKENTFSSFLSYYMCTDGQTNKAKLIGAYL